MLSDDDQKRIRDEEIFRQEVRANLDSTSQSQVTRLFQLLNRPLALWILSAIVATWWTNFLSIQADMRKAAERKADRVERIREELLVRRLPSAFRISAELRVYGSYVANLKGSLPASNVPEFMKLLHSRDHNANDLRKEIGRAIDQNISHIRTPDTVWQLLS